MRIWERTFLPAVGGFKGIRPPTRSVEVGADRARSICCTGCDDRSKKLHDNKFALYQPTADRRDGERLFWARQKSQKIREHIIRPSHPFKRTIF